MIDLEGKHPAWLYCTYFPNRIEFQAKSIHISKLEARLSKLFGRTVLIEEEYVLIEISDEDCFAYGERILGSKYGNSLVIRPDGTFIKRRLPQEVKK